MKKKLRVIGRLTPVAMKRYNEVLGISNSQQPGEIILFCDFSESEIPKDHIFYDIIRNGLRISCPLRLISISQEYLVSLNSIPLGWKTICLFEILPLGDRRLFDNLKEINDWSEGSGSIELC